jgi:RNA polymerase sigma factor (sigma-70 family)
MPAAPLVPILRQLRRVAAGPVAGRPDADLLRQFVRARDEAAFAELVRRHGPLVWGVCARLLADRHAAEDAFQATFLVLARRAASVGRPAAVGCWLYGVARRVAGKLRRRPASAPLPDVVDRSITAPLDALTARELTRLLDDELGRLPDRLRAPLVLCYLEGATRDEAAERLGCPLSTLKKRLERGRDRLHESLVRRGLGLSAALLATLLFGQSAAAVPVAAAKKTAHAALALASGNGTEGVVSSRVGHLVNGGIGMTGSNKVKAEPRALHPGVLRLSRGREMARETGHRAKVGGTPRRLHHHIANDGREPGDGADETETGRWQLQD